MVRTQIQFEEKQYESIRRLAHRKKISISEVIRRLVRAGLKNGLETEERPEPQGLSKIAGIAGSGTRDLGRRHDHYPDRHFRDQGFSTVP